MADSKLSNMMNLCFYVLSLQHIKPMHIEDASILRNLWTFGSSDDGLSVRARIFEDIQMAPSEHFISRVASRKWHSIIQEPIN